MVNRRVLIVSHNSLSLHANNGKTMASLFGNWAEAELAQVYFQEEVPESLRFKRFFRIRDVDVIKKLLFLKPQGVCGAVVTPAGCVDSHYSSVGVLKSFVIKQLKKTESVKLVVRDLLYGTGLWRSANFLNWIREFSPDVLFFVGGNSVFSFRISLWLSWFFRIPLDIYITDDYVVNSKPKGVVSRLLHRKLLKIYRLSFSRARNVFVIGEEMASVFSLFFHRECVPVMNSVPIPKNFVASQSSGCGKVEFVYAGGLHLGRDKALLSFSEILKRASDATGRECSLTVYSSQTPSSSMASNFDKSGINFCGALRQDDLRERLSKADYVLHVESFEDKFAALTTLSVSTKIPECLVSGSCLVAFGPKELASIRLVEKYGLGICLTDPDAGGGGERNLVKAILDGEYRREIIARGFEFAKREFDENQVREKFSLLVNSK